MNSSNLYTPGQDNAPAGTYQEVGPGAARPKTAAPSAFPAATACPLCSRAATSGKRSERFLF